MVLSQSGAHQSAKCQKGIESSQKGVLPKLSRDGGVYPPARIAKMGTWSGLLSSRAIHSKKKKTKLNGWEEPREHDKRCGFSFGVDLAENMDVAVGGNICLPFIGGLGGVVPHNFCTTSDIESEDPTCFCLPQAWVNIFDHRVLITLCGSQREIMWSTTCHL